MRLSISPLEVGGGLRHCVRTEKSARKPLKYSPGWNNRSTTGAPTTKWGNTIWGGVCVEVICIHLLQMEMPERGIQKNWKVEQLSADQVRLSCIFQRRFTFGCMVGGVHSRGIRQPAFSGASGGRAQTASGSHNCQTRPSSDPELPCTPQAQASLCPVNQTLEVCYPTNTRKKQKKQGKLVLKIPNLFLRQSTLQASFGSALTLLGRG